jgi:excisionase family DNA binding protein
MCDYKEPIKETTREPKLLKSKDVIARYPIGKTKLYLLVHTGELKAYKLGERGFLFKPEDVEAALKLASGEQQW